MLKDMSFGTKKLVGTGCPKSIIIPAIWRKALGDLEYFDINVKNDVMIITPHVGN